MLGYNAGGVEAAVDASASKVRVVTVVEVFVVDVVLLEVVVVEVMEVVVVEVHLLHMSGQYLSASSLRSGFGSSHCDSGIPSRDPQSYLSITPWHVPVIYVVVVYVVVVYVVVVVVVVYVAVVYVVVVVEATHLHPSGSQ